MERADLIKGAMAGAAAGLLASFVMNQFQAAWSTAEKQISPEEDESDEDPATVKAADRAAQAATGHPLPEAAKAPAGQAVHYATGAALGALYGALAEVFPKITAGFGSAYGTLVNVVLDEALVPALGLGPSPFKTPFKTHAYGAASHSVFGVALELGRRAARRAL